MIEKTRIEEFSRMTKLFGIVCREYIEDSALYREKVEYYTSVLLKYTEFYYSVDYIDLRTKLELGDKAINWCEDMLNRIKGIWRVFEN